MNKNLDVITHAVTLIIKAAIMAGRFSARVRKRSLKRLAAMDADTEDKEILFLKDKVYQLQMQVFERQGLPAPNAGVDSPEADSETTEKAAIHASRETVYPLAYRDLWDSQTKSD
ncbi:MAG: hypothetical protein ACYSWQ_13150 [Planctomycetota bacterium]|jgi:hypothetical protein